MSDQKGPPYVCFAAQDWWYHNTAHSDFQLMRAVARSRRVLVVNSIGMRMPAPGRSTQPLRRIGRKLRSVAKLVRRPLPDVPEFFVMSPLPLPFYGSPAMRRLGAALVRLQVRAVCILLRVSRPVVVVTLPTAWDVVRSMRRQCLVYNRSDRHSDFPEADKSTIVALEQTLLKEADLVLYVSRSLLEEERALTGQRAQFVDHGVDVEHFRWHMPDDFPEDIRRIPQPRIGFFGALDDFVVDFELLERTAAAFPAASVVLIGDSTHSMERLTSHANVHWLGPKPYAEIPRYGSAFDVAIMPWLSSPWIKSANPIKLKEYLALGLPIVSTDFCELTNYRDRVRVASDHAGFIQAVEQTLADGGISSPGARRESVLAYSWDSRGDLLRQLAEGGPK